MPLWADALREGLRLEERADGIEGVIERGDADIARRVDDWQFQNFQAAKIVSELVLPEDVTLTVDIDPASLS